MSKCQSSVYKRRLPEQSALYKLIQQNLESWLSEYSLNHQESVPYYVENELKNYLKCGILAHGFARARCSACGHDFIIAFSCKKRVCPSCCTKYMELTTAHVLDNILPMAPARQLVLSLPKWIRYYTSRDSDLSNKVLKIFIDAIEQQYKKNVTTAPAKAQIGAITFIQRFGSSLNLHCHYHTLVMEVLFYHDDQGQIKTVPIESLGQEDCLAILDTVRLRVLKLYLRNGLLTADQVDLMRSWKNSGFSVNGDVGIDATDRRGLKRVIRNCARPALADKQVSLTKNDRVKFELSKPSVKGETELILSAHDFLDRLAQVIPKPRKHRHHYHRALAPNSPFRKHIVAYAGQPLPETLGERSPPTKPSKIKDKLLPKIRSMWAILLASVYEIMPLICPNCGDEMKIIAFINDIPSINKLLTHLELPAEAPELSPARGPPIEYDQVELDIEDTFADLPDDNIDQSVIW